MQPDPRLTGSTAYVQWGPVFAGALIAAGVSLVLHSFAAAIGLAVSSTAPTWRDASLALWLLSGVYLVVVAAAAYSLGGYVAGRMREGLVDASRDEIEFRDGIHGLLVWALATLLTALFAVAIAEGVSRLAAPASAPRAESSSAGENLFPYEIDRLFRSDRPVPDLAPAREEASRILMTAGGTDGVTPDDRSYLARLVATRTGVTEAEAQQRTQSAISSASDSIRRARHSGILLAFFAGAAAAIGAAAAWFSAGIGGQHRDSSKWPSLGWTVRRRGPVLTSRG